MPGASAEDIREKLRSEYTQLLVSRIRIGFGILIVGRLSLAFADLRAQSEALPPLMVIGGLLCAALAAGLVLLRRCESRRRAIAIALSVTGTVWMAMAFTNVLRHDGMTPLPLYMLMVVGAAVLIPWGAGPQLVTVLTAGLAVLVNVYATLGGLGPVAGYSGLGMLLAGTLSVYLAHRFESTRRAFAERELDRARTRDAMRRALEEKSGQLQTLADAMAAYLEAGDWRSASAILVGGALRQTGSECGMAGVLLEEGSVLRILARVRIDGDLTTDAERDDVVAPVRRADGAVLDVETLFGQVIATRRVVRANHLPSAPPGAAAQADAPSAQHLLAVPVLKGGQVVGVIGVARSTDPYGDADEGKLDFLCRTAGAIYAAFQQTQHEMMLQSARDRQQEQITALLEVAKDIGGTVELGEVFVRVQRRTAALLPCDRVAILSWDARRKTYAVMSHYGTRPELIASTVAIAFASGTPFVERLTEAQTVVASDTGDPRWREVLAAFRAGGLAAIPMRVRERAVGALVAMHDSSAKGFDATQIALLEGIACHLALAIDASQTLANVSPIGIFRVDAAGYTEYINERCAALIGMTPAEALGKSWLVGVHPGDHELIATELARARQARLPFRCEYRLRTPSGATTWVLGQAMAEKGADGRVRGYVGTVLDITERKHAEAALQESEARYRHIFSAAPVSLWEEDFSPVKAMVDELRASGVEDLRAHLDAHPEFVRRAVQAIRVIDVNDETLKLFGATSKAQMLGSLAGILLPETMAAFEDEILALANGELYFESETSVQTLQGERREVLFTMSFAEHSSRVDRVLVSIMDITERVRAERSLVTAERAKQDAAHAAADAERRRLARELHDGVLQDLGAIKLLLEAHRKRAASADTELVLQRLRQCLDDIRAVVDDLRTPDASLSLQEAIAAHARVLTMQRPIAVELALQPTAVVDWAVRDLYRIAQEAIANVVRHAHPSRLRVDLYSENGETTLRIADDGAGFDPDTPRRGNGLLGIRERAASLGAELEIVSAPGRGTTVQVVLPHGRSPAICRVGSLAAGETRQRAAAERLAVN